MKKNTRKKLTISRETVRSLSPREAQDAVGGIPTTGAAPRRFGDISVPIRACCLGPEEVFLPAPPTNR